MNDTLAKDHQLPVNLKSTKGRQTPLCAPQLCATADVEIPLGVTLQQKYVRPPIRSRECCGGPTTTENVPYFSVIPVSPEPPPPPPILRHLHVVLQGLSFVGGPQSYFNIYGVPASGTELVLISQIQLSGKNDGDNVDVTDDLVAISGYTDMIGYAIGYISDPGSSMNDANGFGSVTNLDSPGELWNESFDFYTGVSGSQIQPVWLAPLAESMANVSLETFISPPNND